MGRLGNKKAGHSTFNRTIRFICCRTYIKRAHMRDKTAYSFAPQPEHFPSAVAVCTPGQWLHTSVVIFFGSDDDDEVVMLSSLLSFLQPPTARRNPTASNAIVLRIGKLLPELCVRL
jgi:hypothetical protein